jgi:Ca-activated chloride channel family protein
MGGFGGSDSRPASATPSEAKAPGYAVNVKDAEGRDGVAETVRRVGAKTFYYKDNGWIDSAVGSDELARAVVLQQFSDAFFKLVRTQSAEQNQYFTFEEPVTVKLAGTVYRVDPATP